MIRPLVEFFNRQIREIAAEPALRFYGVLLSATFLLTFWFWHTHGTWQILTDTTTPACWPFWPGCADQRFYDVTFWRAVIAGMALSAAVAALAFATNRVRIAVLFLAAATLLKAWVQIQDYRLMGNYHYMQFAVCGVFLVARGKRGALIALLPFFYLMAGVLKLNPEWMSGAALWLPSIPLPWFLLRPGVLYVVFLELVIIWWLFSPSLLLRWAALLQILVFHFISILWVGFFYPSTMIALMGFFVLAWHGGRATPLELKKLAPEMKVFLGLLLLAQAVSLWPSRDSALFTSSRLAALNMFDARTTCQPSIWIRRSAHERVHLPVREERLGIRIRCDPVLYENMARNLCRDEQREHRGAEVDLFLVARRETDSRFTRILSEHDVCARLGRRSWLDWLRGEWPP